MSDQSSGGFHNGETSNFSGSPSGEEIGTRVTRVETHLQHVATKVDIQAMKTEIQKMKTWILGGVIGGMIIVATMVISVLKLFP